MDVVRFSWFLFHSLSSSPSCCLSGILWLSIDPSGLLQSPGLLQQDRKGSGTGSLLAGKRGMFLTSLLHYWQQLQDSANFLSLVQYKFSQTRHKLAREAETKRKRVCISARKTPTIILLCWRWAELHHPHRQAQAQLCVPVLSIEATRASIWGVSLLYMMDT